ncbi:MAG: hypothetical protein PHP57_06960 [Sideroxydans sp.]|nr:hypothetical protein [Sideroxydans sp.]
MQDLTPGILYYRDGVLGRISLETPASREEMLMAALPQQEKTEEQ